MRSLTLNYPSIVSTIVQENYYLAALPENNPMAQKMNLRLADLRDEPFIMPSPLDDSATYMSMMRACEHAGFVPNIVQEASQAQTIVALVESGLGVALVPNVWQDPRPGRSSFVSSKGCPKPAWFLPLRTERKKKMRFYSRLFAGLWTHQPNNHLPCCAVLCLGDGKKADRHHRELLSYDLRAARKLPCV